MLEARRRYDEQARWDEFQRRSRDWQASTGHREFLADTGSRRGLSGSPA